MHFGAFQLRNYEGFVVFIIVKSVRMEKGSSSYSSLPAKMNGYGVSKITVRLSIESHVIFCCQSFSNLLT